MDKENSSERPSNLPEVTQLVGDPAGLSRQAPVMKFPMPTGDRLYAGGALGRPVQLGLLFVKEEVDTQHWEVSALGSAPGCWQNQAGLGNFLLALDAWWEGYTPRFPESEGKKKKLVGRVFPPFCSF